MTEVRSATSSVTPVLVAVAAAIDAVIPGEGVSMAQLAGSAIILNVVG